VGRGMVVNVLFQRGFLKNPQNASRQIVSVPEP
jgi:hypothetical protein